METSLRFSRRTFVAWVGGASAGFYLFGRLPGAGAPTALAQIPGGTLDPTTVAKFETPLLIPPVMPRAGTITQPGGKPRRLLRDLDAAVRAADPAGGPAGDDGVGLRREGGAEQPRAAHPQRPVADDRGEVEPAGAGQVDQRARRRERQLPAAPAAGRPDAALGEPAGRHRRARQPADVRPRRPAPYTGPVPIVTHVHGAVGVGDESDGYAEAWYLPAANNIPAGYATEGHLVRLLRRQGGGGLRRRRGDPASPPSSTRTTTGRRRSGTTTTRSA